MSTDLCEVFSQSPCDLESSTELDRVDTTEEIGAAIAIVYLRNDGTLFVHAFELNGARMIGGEHLGIELVEEPSPGEDIFDVVEPSAWISVGSDGSETLPILIIEGALSVSDAGIETEAST